MSSSLTFDPIRLPEACQALRREARAFLAEEIARGTFDPNNPRQRVSLVYPILLDLIVRDDALGATSLPPLTGGAGCC